MITTNNNKFFTAKRTLEKYGIVLEHVKMSLLEIQSYNVDEVIAQKLKSGYEKIKKPCIVHDSGFFIPELGGFPGALAHPVLEKIDIEGILKLLEGKKDNQRTCYFYEVVGYLDGSMKEPIFFDQKTFGTIATKPIGNEDGHHWSRLFEIFIPENYSETLAQIGEEKYLKWRQDKKIDQYLEKFAEWYLKNKK